MAYLWFFWFVLTTLTVAALKYLDPEKARPSVDDGASAAEQMTMQQRVMKAVSLKNVTQSKPLLLVVCTAVVPHALCRGHPISCRGHPHIMQGPSPTVHRSFTCHAGVTHISCRGHPLLCSYGVQCLSD